MKASAMFFSHSLDKVRVVGYPIGPCPNPCFKPCSVPQCSSFFFYHQSVTASLHKKMPQEKCNACFWHLPGGEACSVTEGVVSRVEAPSLKQPTKSPRRSKNSRERERDKKQCVFGCLDYFGLLNQKVQEYSHSLRFGPGSWSVYVSVQSATVA